MTGIIAFIAAFIWSMIVLVVGSCAVVFLLYIILRRIYK